MQAVVYDRFGPPEVLRVAELAPPEQQSGRARVEVHACGLNPKDVLIRKGRMGWLAGRRLPRTPGYDVAGVLLDAAGTLPAGTEVFGMIQSHRGGGCAEVASLLVDEVARKPAALSMVEAAALPLAGLTALQALRDELRLTRGQSLLLNGASGGVGTLAVQIARALGAGSVHASCSAANAELVGELGADEVHDYRNESLADLSGFDALFDIYGSFRWESARPVLTPTGRYCTTIPYPSSIARGFLRRLGLHRAALVVVRSRSADLDQLRAFVDAGELRPVLDDVIPLSESRRGHERLETRRARGKVVIELAR